MSGTYLYLVNQESVEASAALIESFRISKPAFESFLERAWGEVRYPHEAFLADSESQRLSNRHAAHRPPRRVRPPPA